MHIMTTRGWMPLLPFCTNEVWELVSWDENKKRYEPDGNGTLMKIGETDFIEPAPKPYDGKFPSHALCTFVNRIFDDEVKFFDYGVRMVYGQPDRHIEVDNAIPQHPIDYPPPGF